MNPNSKYWYSVVFLNRLFNSVQKFVIQLNEGTQSAEKIYFIIQTWIYVFQDSIETDRKR